MLRKHRPSVDLENSKTKAKSEISEELMQDCIWFHSFTHYSFIELIFRGDFHRQYFRGAGRQPPERSER